jgi:hypothetical protein
MQYGGDRVAGGGAVHHPGVITLAPPHGSAQVPSSLLAAISRKVPVNPEDLQTAAMRCKQLGSHLRRAARCAETVTAEEPAS